ncbi:type I-G CRISPR-associated protein Cas8g1/Csx17 [Caenispirillum bisanense]|uniref:type I-G CRISPR-associated protein Cas8g1/Csx17 n=1 Tax=Caenispirillum bisanense TaxID=414052 RepID=UPI0031D55DA5
MATADWHDHVLAGCAPVPLAGYLKALGILRLVAEQADDDARGWWQDEVFHLRTRLRREDLLAFFLNAYRPSPVVAPWNGGSGFFAPGTYAPLTNSAAPRLSAFREAVLACEEALAETGLGGRPQGAAKAEFVQRLRGRLADEALAWLDAALTLTPSDLRFPPLLGTGGNDGRLDFTNNFMQRLVSPSTPQGLFDAATGAPRPAAAAMLPGALYGVPVGGLVDAAIGQFAPGAAGGPNSTSGFKGGGNVNPWDFVLMVEGALSFAGAVTRRNENARRSGASFPFTVKPTGAGWGGIDVEDEGDARAEFWAPLWGAPATMPEITRLLAEGRAVLNGRTARDGLEFARAAAALGTSRGISAFQRFGFVMRAGKAFLATPLGRRPVARAASGTVTLIADLERGHWLERARLKLRSGEEAARARGTVRRLDDALFALSDPGAGAIEVQAALMALGGVVRYLSTAPRVREVLPPPPVLSPRWRRLADDGSPEFAVAAALASLGYGPVGEVAAAPSVPMAAHFAPLDLSQPFRGNVLWHEDKPRKPDTRDGRLEAVWNDGDLPRNLITVLERRLIGRTDTKDGEGDPLRAAFGAPLSAVLAFLAGSPFFDDARCAALLAGLAWVSPGQSPLRSTSGDQRLPMPLAFAVLKPLFIPADRLRKTPIKAGSDAMLLAEGRSLPVPPGLVARLRRGDLGTVVRDGLARARASGLSSPFVGERAFADGVSDPRRLAAALIIPLDDAGLARVIERAYPPPADGDPKSDTEPADHEP